MLRCVTELSFLIVVALLVVPPSEDATVDLSLYSGVPSGDGGCSGELADSSSKVFLGDSIGVVFFC